MAVVEEDASAGDAVVCPVVDAATEVWVFTEEVFACGLYAVISFREIVRDALGPYLVIEQLGWNVGELDCNQYLRQQLLLSNDLHGGSRPIEYRSEC